MLVNIVDLPQNCEEFIPVVRIIYKLWVNQAKYSRRAAAAGYPYTLLWKTKSRYLLGSRVIYHSKSDLTAQ